MIALQRCACGAWQYPRRDACRVCLSDTLADAEHAGTGVVLAAAVVRVSLDPASRLPQPVVTVQLDDGPHLIAFGDAPPRARVRLTVREGLFHAELAP